MPSLADRAGLGSSPTPNLAAAGIDSVAIAPRASAARVFASLVGAGLSGGVGAGVFDVLVAVGRAGEPTGARAVAWSLVAAVSLAGAAGAAVGAALAVVAAGLVATVNLDVGAWLRGIRADAARDRAQAAGIWAATAGLGVVGAAVTAVDLSIGGQMAVRRNGAITTGAVAMMMVPLVALAWFPLYQVMRSVVRWVPRPRVVYTLGALAAVIGVGAVAALASVDWRIIDFGPTKVFTLFVVLGVGHAWFWGRGAGARFTAARPRAIRATVATAVLATLVCLGATWVGFGHDPRSLALVGEETMGVRTLLSAARRLADRDHDGYAIRLGGGDCDDRNPAIHPGAVDVRGNGVDEDCDGADAPHVARTPSLAPTSDVATRFEWKGNLLVILIDTLRADYVTERSMPRLAALARQSVMFTHAYAQAPNTPLSVPSVLTSRLPSEIRWVHSFDAFPQMVITPTNTSFFQVIHNAGLRTVGVMSHFYMEPRSEVASGFDDWSNDGAVKQGSKRDIAAPRITDRVVAKLGTLAAAKQRFALWTHLFDPHSEYMDHPDLPAHGGAGATPRQRYEGEVSFVDRHLGRIFDALVATGLDANTAVVVFADHGESFGEHTLGGRPIFFHGETLYDEILHVPLVMRVPGVAPRAVDGPVMLIDLGPTLVDMVKGSRPPSFRGRTLLGALLGQPLAPQPVVAELLPAPAWNHRTRVIMDAGFKLIDKLSENTAELYDLEHDPGERRNLSVTDVDRAVSLRRELGAFVSAEAF